jgi:hypothetical protein
MSAFTRVWDAPCLAPTNGQRLPVRPGSDPTMRSMNVWAAPLVAHWFEQLGELSNAQVELDLLVLPEHHVEIALAGGGLAACLLDDPVGFRLADPGCERE